VRITHELGRQAVTSIDGYTAAWDRPVWVMRSESILIKKRRFDF
jgi:hypothetical protein